MMVLIGILAVLWALSWFVLVIAFIKLSFAFAKAKEPTAFKQTENKGTHISLSERQMAKAKRE